MGIFKFRIMEPKRKTFLQKLFEIKWRKEDLEYLDSFVKHNKNEN